ncbi:MAG: hypothetical protein PVF58_18735 [Candidatus Methanofastidiosia archaeon]|jgi:hypothetical protein
MNVRTLRKTLDTYGFETEKVMDTLLDVFIKQNVSDRGVLAEDVSGVTGVLYSYNLLEKISWAGLALLKCTPKGENTAKQLVKESIPEVFKKFKKLNLEGTYIILKYLIYLLNEGKNNSLRRPELKALSSLPVVQELKSAMRSILVENTLARYAHTYTASGPVKKVLVTLPDFFDYIEQYYVQKDKIVHFQEVINDISKTLNLFRLLYYYDTRTERVYMRKMKEFGISKEVSNILHDMKQENLIRYIRKPFLFKIEDKNKYRQYLKEHVLSPVLEEFSRHFTQIIRSNSQAYTTLADFEEDFREFLQRILQDASDSWEERIPDDILKRLKKRQKDAEIRRKTVYPLLHYADFPNYLSIILYRTNSFSNWDLFEFYFLSIGWIKGRLIEMNEIRNDLAHPKPLEPLQFRKLQLYIDEIRERIKRD